MKKFFFSLVLFFTLLNFTSQCHYVFDMQAPYGLFSIPKFERTGAESLEFKKSGKSIKTLKFFNPKDNFNEFNIVEFTNLKRQGLKNMGKYDDKKISIAYQYEDGSWGGTKFYGIDEQVTINRRYGEDVPTDRIVGFVIKFK